MSKCAGTALSYRLYRPGIPIEAVQLLTAEACRLASAPTAGFGHGHRAGARGLV